MSKENPNRTEGKVLYSQSDANSTNIKYNSFDTDKKVIDENNGNVYSVGDVLDIAGKHSGSNTKIP